MPNKKSENSGIYKYNQEIIKLKKKKSKIKIIHTGNYNSYINTLFYKFLLIPIYLIFNSYKFKTVILPEEGYAFLVIFSLAKKNKIIIHDYRRIFSIHHKIKLKEKIKQLYLNINFFFLNKFKKIIVPSKFTKKLILKNLSIDKNKIDFIPNIINFNNKRPIFNKKFNAIREVYKKKFTVMSITSNETRKNSDTLIEIARELGDTNFIIIGNLGNKKLPKNIYNFKNLSNENLIYLFDITNIYIDVSIFEGFGRCLIEAQSFNLNVICFNTEINREIINKSGFLINSRNKKSIIKRILENKNLKKKNKISFNNAKKFTALNVYRNFKKEINEI